MVEDSNQELRKEVERRLKEVADLMLEKWTGDITLGEAHTDPEFVSMLEDIKQFMKDNGFTDIDKNKVLANFLLGTDDEEVSELSDTPDLDIIEDILVEAGIPIEDYDNPEKGLGRLGAICDSIEFLIRQYYRYIDSVVSLKCNCARCNPGMPDIDSYYEDDKDE